MVEVTKNLRVQAERTELYTAVKRLSTVIATPRPWGYYRVVQSSEEVEYSHSNT